MLGEVKFFNPERGWGFIIGEDTQQYFVYYKQIDTDGYKTLLPEQKVEFVPAKGNKGLEAHSVNILKKT